MRRFYDSCLFALLFALFVRLFGSRPFPNCIPDNLHKGPQRSLLQSPNPTTLKFFQHLHAFDWGILARVQQHFELAHYDSQP